MEICAFTRDTVTSLHGRTINRDIKTMCYLNLTDTPNYGSSVVFIFSQISLPFVVIVWFYEFA